MALLRTVSLAFFAASRARAAEGLLDDALGNGWVAIKVGHQALVNDR